MHTVPEFLHDMLAKQYGEEIAARIEDGFRARRATSARVNTLKASTDGVIADLARQGVQCERLAWSDTALVLSCDDRTAAGTDVFEQGKIYLQSLSAMLPVLFLGAQVGENILDMAAAPGGKTTQIAAMTDGGAFITACEKNPVRADRLKYNLEKQGVKRVTVMREDARRLDPLFVFDRILLDAPCSGSGTLELSADKPPVITRELVERSVRTQRGMLRTAVARLRAGHEMIYSTCSLLGQENEGVVRSVLKSAEIVPICAPQDVPTLPVSLPGTLCVAPTDRYEGFYVAKLRKK